MTETESQRISSTIKKNCQTSINELLEKNFIDDSNLENIILSMHQMISNVSIKKEKILKDYLDNEGDINDLIKIDWLKSNYSKNIDKIYRNVLKTFFSGEKRLSNIKQYIDNLKNLQEDVQNATTMFIECIPKVKYSQFKLCLTEIDSNLSNEEKEKRINMCKSYIEAKQEEAKKYASELDLGIINNIIKEETKKISSNVENVLYYISGILGLVNIIVGSGEKQNTNNNPVDDFIDLLGPVYFQEKISKIKSATCLGKIAENKFAEYGCYISTAIAGLELIKSYINDRTNDNKINKKVLTDNGEENFTDEYDEIKKLSRQTVKKFSSADLLKYKSKGGKTKNKKNKRKKTRIKRKN